MELWQRGYGLELAAGFSGKNGFLGCSPKTNRGGKRVQGKDRERAMSSEHQNPSHPANQLLAQNCGKAGLLIQPDKQELNVHVKA